MKKFILKSFIFLAILSAVFFYFSLNFKRKYNTKTDYLATIIDKHQRLNTVDSNRIILLGGSNLSFGINSALLQEKLSKNVINLGLHAGLSLKFMLNEVKPSIKKGDIIVLCLEYPLYLDGFKADVDLISFIQELYPAANAYYHFDAKEKFISYYEKFKKNFEEQAIKIDPVFNRLKFNKYGDNIGHLNLPSLTELRDKEPIGKLEIDKSVELINDFSAYCKQKQALLLISYVAYPKSEFKKNKNTLNQLNTLLKANIHDVKFINKPETFVFDDSMFYDTIYHLNKKGREKRTQIFIKNLDPYISFTSENKTR